MIPLPDISIATAAKLGLAFVAALALALLVHDRNRWKSVAAARQQQLSQTKAAFDQTVANYRAAADRARKTDAANAARVKAEQVQINERTADDYQTRIAAARARYQRLLADADAPADRGGGGAAPVPRLPAAAGGPAEAAGQDGLPPADRELATEQAIQLDELIEWVRAQAQVDPNAVAPAKAGVPGRECTDSTAATPPELQACAGTTR